MDQAYQKYAKIRDSKGLTDYRVSQISGVSRSNLSDWKLGRTTPKRQTLQRIADALGVPLSELMELSIDFQVRTPDGDVSVLTVDSMDSRAAEQLRKLNTYAARLDREDIELLVNTAARLASQPGAVVSSSGDQGEAMAKAFKDMISGREGDRHEKP